MDKIIIHNHIKDTSYAFTLAEVAYREYLLSDEYDGNKDMRFNFSGSQNIVAVAKKNDKSVTIIIKYSI